MPKILVSVLSMHIYMFLHKTYIFKDFFQRALKVTCTGDHAHFVRHCVDLLYENCYNICRELAVDAVLIYIVFILLFYTMLYICMYLWVNYVSIHVDYSGHYIYDVFARLYW